MSNKMMLGLVMSAAVGLGAAAAAPVAHANKYPYPGYDQIEYTKKALIVVDPDYKYQNNDFCKAPFKIKGKYVKSDEANATVSVIEKVEYYKKVKYLKVNCKFNDEVKYGHYYPISKENFYCKAIIKDYPYKTNYSDVSLTFPPPAKQEYYPAGGYKKTVNAYVDMNCYFKLKYEHKPPYGHKDDKYGNED